MDRYIMVRFQKFQENITSLLLRHKNYVITNE